MDSANSSIEIMNTLKEMLQSEAGKEEEESERWFQQFNNNNRTTTSSINIQEVVRLQNWLRDNLPYGGFTDNKKELDEDNIDTDGDEDQEVH